MNSLIYFSTQNIMAQSAAIAFLFIFIAALCFGFKRATWKEYTCAGLYFISTLGVIFSGNGISLALSWEAMALVSTLLLLCAGNRTHPAAYRYFLMHVFGGTCLLAGIALLAAETQSLVLGTISTNYLFCEPMRSQGLSCPATSLTDIGAWLLLTGILVNLAALPVSAWLPDSYPKSTAMGGVLLSAFTTKTALFVLFMHFSPSFFFAALGAVMAFYGLYYALRARDLRQWISYIIILQIAGALLWHSVDTQSAGGGLELHTIRFLFYYELSQMFALAALMLAAGYMEKSSLPELGGILQKHRSAGILILVALASLAGFPFTLGFVTKAQLFLLHPTFDARSLGTYCISAATLISFPWRIFLPVKAPQNYADYRFRIPAYLFIFLLIAPGIYLTFAHWHVSILVKAAISIVIISLSLGIGWKWLNLLFSWRKDVRDVDWLYRVALLRVWNILHNGVALQYANAQKLFLLLYHQVEIRWKNYSFFTHVFSTSFTLLLLVSLLVMLLVVAL